ncbi:hypothetical protein RRG08_021445 [Elysia crispata]|uniref:Uncharacterized protein n=1 Tax=Elysia crispata TaxID=231223 RepID=A0AAE1DSZ1_9GAST|nr:hypothetical protein RRG08_021445 [Elysia crispata]
MINLPELSLPQPKLLKVGDGKKSMSSRQEKFTKLLHSWRTNVFIKNKSWCKSLGQQGHGKTLIQILDPLLDLNEELNTSILHGFTENRDPLRAIASDALLSARGFCLTTRPTLI